MPGADAFLGKITPAMLAAADRLRWVQSFTASLEHYMFPELEAHPCVLTNVRGLFGDVIADQVMGYVLCFARNLHTYIRRQVEHRYEPIGGESARVSNRTGPGTVNAWIGRRSICPRRRWGSSAWEGSAARSRGGRWRSGCRSAASIDFPSESQPPEGVQSVQGVDRLPELLALERLRRDRRAAHAGDRRLVQRRDARRIFGRRSYLINIGRGAIVVLDDLVAALARRQARRGGARRLRDRAAAAGASALGLSQRDPHAAHRRLFAGDRRPAPGDAGRKRGPVRPRRAALERRRQGVVVLIENSRWL